MKARKKKKGERKRLHRCIASFTGRVSGPFTPLFINGIKVEIKNRGFSRASNSGDRLSTKGRRRWRFSSIRVAEGLEKGG